MRKIISLICLLLPILAYAETVALNSDSSGMRQDIRPDAPDRYTVVKGDTLWDISGKFFKDPWKWPHIWGMNKESIKNPHWIYPGDIIILDRTTGTLQIGGETAPVAAAPESGSTTEESGVVKLSPQIHEGPSEHDAIPSIPAKVIAPFLVQPLVIDEDALKRAPVLIGAREGRVLLGKDDTVFAKDVPSDQGYKWQIYRPGKTLTDPDTDEELGVEAIYLGDAEATKLGDISTLQITNSLQEIYAGDRLVAPSFDSVNSYLPRAPEANISAQVISIYGGMTQGGQNSVITLNKGKRDGLENGHVLALYRKGEQVTMKSDSLFSWDKTYTLPDERYGLVFVFRVFDKVSYALVMQTKLPVQLMDRANTP